MERVLACLASDVEKGSSQTLELAGRKVALFRNSDGNFFATQDSCTHEQWSLGEDSDLEGNQVTCPLHMACFDIRSGAALSLPATEALTTYPVDVDPDEKVYIVIDGAARPQ
jgi:nitrite reductase/ring-hydroxylating ferredoxin subunit